MTPEEIRRSIHDILDAHDAALSAIRVAHGAMALSQKAHDDALVSAIEANRAALRLLDRLSTEERR